MLLQDAFYPIEWFRRHPEAGSSWPSWPRVLRISASLSFPPIDALEKEREEREREDGAAEGELCCCPVQTPAILD